MKVLVVDDDEQLRRALRINLQARGHTVAEAADGHEAVEATGVEGPDLVILDLGLPLISGVRVVGAIRAISAAPILVLSGRTDSAEKVEALDAGANDYVTKPFSIDELLARVRVLTRDPLKTTDQVHVLGSVVVDLERHTVVHNAGDALADIKLTPTEWGVLEMLLRNPDRLVTKKEILATVWGAGYSTEDAYLRLYLSQLRSKIEELPSRPRYLVTEPGLGYRYISHPTN